MCHLRRSGDRGGCIRRNPFESIAGGGDPDILQDIKGCMVDALKSNTYLHFRIICMLFT